MKTRQDNNVVDRSGAIYAKNNTELCVRSNLAPTMMKTRHDNNITKHIRAIYAKNETQLLHPIELSAVCDENQIGQQHDLSYRSVIPFPIGIPADSCPLNGPQQRRHLISCPTGVCPVDWCLINWCTLISVLRRE